MEVDQVDVRWVTDQRHLVAGGRTAASIWALHYWDIMSHLLGRNQKHKRMNIIEHFHFWNLPKTPTRLSLCHRGAKRKNTVSWRNITFDVLIWRLFVIAVVNSITAEPLTPRWEPMEVKCCPNTPAHVDEESGIQVLIALRWRRPALPPEPHKHQTSIRNTTKRKFNNLNELMKLSQFDEIKSR